MILRTFKKKKTLKTVFDRLSCQIRKPVTFITARWSNKTYKQTNINDNLNVQAVAGMSQQYWLCRWALCLLHSCSAGQLLRHEIIVTGCSAGICITMICHCTLHVLHRWSAMLSRSILEERCINLVRLWSELENQINEAKQNRPITGKGREDDKLASEKRWCFIALGTFKSSERASSIYEN